MKEIDELMEVKPEIIAMDATISTRPGNKTLDKFFHEVKEKYPDQLFMADCSTVEEALHADELGFDFIYERLDKFLRNLPNDFSDIEISKIMKKFESNKYKIKTINISSKLPIFCDEIMKVRLEA
jgi:N-acylglucosamine-6-phosphate 2-epimerase